MLPSPRGARTQTSPLPLSASIVQCPPAPSAAPVSHELSQRRGDSVLAIDEVVLVVAFFIPDAPTLLAYVDALRPRELLGRLEHFHQLTLTRPIDKLWPRLHIETTFSPVERGHVEAIANQYSHVVVSNVHAFDWLKGLLNPSATLTWIGLPAQTLSQEWCDELATLPITRLAGTDCWSHIPHYLPSLPHLASLELGETSSRTIEAAFEYAAHHPELTTLTFGAATFTMTTAVLQNAVQWLQAAPVKHFEFSHMTVNDVVDKDLAQKYYDALFGCPTMEVLVCKKTSFAGTTFPTLPGSLKSLVFLQCIMTSTEVESLAAELPGSNVSKLELRWSYQDESVVGLSNLLMALPSTRITELNLTGCYVTDPNWQRLLPLLAPSHLEWLDLTGNSLSDCCLRLLVQAIKSIKTLRVIIVCKVAKVLADVLPRQLESCYCIQRKCKIHV